MIGNREWEFMKKYYEQKYFGLERYQRYLGVWDIELKNGSKKKD